MNEQQLYGQLAESIRSGLWRMGWTNLRPIQYAAIETILQSEQDVIISARTAAGKTEAAFLPILSRMIEQPSASLGAIYVSPLKALINDQFQRLEELCGHAEIPVHRWHGDVGASAKKKLVEEPSGVLLITPESLESLFINRSGELGRLFVQLRFVVIDELHAFVGSPRGMHLRSLLYRVARRAQGEPRIVALSATLGEWEQQYAAWIRPQAPDRVTVLTVSDEGEREVRLRITGFYEQNERDADPEHPLATEGPEAAVEEMLQAFSRTKNLIFANARSDVESFADALNEQCRKLGQPEIFLVHHGSLSKEVREQTESLMRQDTPHTTLCSATLELGIDIGNVKAVGQIGAPWSVSSMLQRLGRSGRKQGEVSEMRMFVPVEVPNEKLPLMDRVQPELLQAIALVELMLQRWLEPPNLERFDLSTLIQQILSLLAERGGATALWLHQMLVTEGAFNFVDQPTFIDVLRGLGQHELISQVPEGDLIIDVAGERIVNHYDFYSAFMAPSEFAARHGSRTIGMLSALSLPAVDDYLILAGRRWQVTGIDTSRREIQVIPAKGKKAPNFESKRPGEIHTRVRQMMRRVLSLQQEYVYLSPVAQQALHEARLAAREAGLTQGVWVEEAGSVCQWFPWVGTRAMLTLSLLAKAAGLNMTLDKICLIFRHPLVEVREKLALVAEYPPTAIDLARLADAPCLNKYDEYLTSELQVINFANNALDIDEATTVLREQLELE